MSTATSTTFKPIFFSLREQIAERIRTDVMCGRLPEGERLNEIKLGKQFGVSRTPIREALQQLVYEGILEGRPNTGLKVASRPTDAVCEFIVIVRRMVEVFAVRLCFDDLTAGEFVGWRAILERMRLACEAEDYMTIAECDIEFHRSLVRRSEYPDLEKLWSSLVARVRCHFWDTQREDYAEAMDIYEEHVRILDALRGEDVEAAIKTLEENIN